MTQRARISGQPAPRRKFTVSSGWGQTSIAAESSHNVISPRLLGPSGIDARSIVEVPVRGLVMFAAEVDQEQDQDNDERQSAENSSNNRFCPSTMSVIAARESDI